MIKSSYREISLQELFLNLEKIIYFVKNLFSEKYYFIYGFIFN